jgi:hypothetical protein
MVNKKQICLLMILIGTRISDATISDATNSFFGLRSRPRSADPSDQSQVDGESGSLFDMGRGVMQRAASTLFSQDPTPPSAETTTRGSPSSGPAASDATLTPDMPKYWDAVYGQSEPRIDALFRFYEMIRQVLSSRDGTDPNTFLTNIQDSVNRYLNSPDLFQIDSPAPSAGSSTGEPRIDPSTDPIYQQLLAHLIVYILDLAKPATSEAELDLIDLIGRIYLTKSIDLSVFVDPQSPGSPPRPQTGPFAADEQMILKTHLAKLSELVSVNSTVDKLIEGMNAAISEYNTFTFDRRHRLGDCIGLIIMLYEAKILQLDGGAKALLNLLHTKWKDKLGEDFEAITKHAIRFVKATELSAAYGSTGLSDEGINRDLITPIESFIDVFNRNDIQAIQTSAIAFKRTHWDAFNLFIDWCKFMNNDRYKRLYYLIERIATYSLTPPPGAPSAASLSDSRFARSRVLSSSTSIPDPNSSVPQPDGRPYSSSLTKSRQRKN